MQQLNLIVVSCDETFVTPEEWTWTASLVRTRVTDIATEWKTIGTSQKLSKDRKYIFLFSIRVLTYVWIENRYANNINTQI